MYNQEIETQKPLLGFEIQTDHQISARRPDLVIVYKKKKKKEKENLLNSGVCRFGWPQGETEGKRKER